MPLNLGELQKRKEEIERRRQGVEFYTLSDGKNLVRILPRSMKYFDKEGDDDFAYRYFVHYNMFEVDGYRMIVCRKTVGEECPICELAETLEDKVKLRARERFIYNVLDLNDPGKIKVMETGPKIYEEILKFVLNPEWGDLFGIKDGRNITIEKIPPNQTRTGWTDYTVMPSPQKSDVTELLPEGWEDMIDTLVGRIPKLFEVDEMKRLVECYKKGEPPNLEEMEKRQEMLNDRKKEVEKVGQQPVEKKEETRQLECFGKDFSVRNEKCKVCPERVACKEAFIKSLG